jgi:hypothetical protein
MNIDNLNGLPPWKDNPQEGESWKTNITTEACKALYVKWGEIIGMLTAALGTMKDLSEEKDENAFITDQKAMIFGDAYEVGAKIRSSEAGNMYILRMENASIIRKNAQFVKSSVLNLMMEGEVDEEYGEIIRNEIDTFRGMFIKWVNTFQKDEYTDDWGLYV